jgi:hypothetical protein
VMRLHDEVNKTSSRESAKSGSDREKPDRHIYRSLAGRSRT